MVTEREIILNLKEEYVKQLPLMGSPVPVILILISYLLLILKIGPYFMKNRPAYDLNKVLIVYNVVQVVVSWKLMYTGIEILRKHGIIDSMCNWEKDYVSVVDLAFFYLLAKISELLDTIFFVLRKKQNQVTFLHVYHHSLMVLLMWSCMLYEHSYVFVFICTINSFVHVVMYTYYGLAAIPALTKYLWWKKYLTTLQLVQFASFFILVIMTAMISECPPSSMLLSVLIANISMITILFAKFYIDAYLKNTKIDMGDFVCSNVNQSDFLNEMGLATFINDCETDKND